MIICIFSTISMQIVMIAIKIKKSEKAVTLWANSTSEIIVKDIKAYNTACFRLLTGYAFVLLMIGLIISLNHIALMIIGYLGIVFSSLILMVIYTMIESKFRA